MPFVIGDVGIGQERQATQSLALKVGAQEQAGRAGRTALRGKREAREFGLAADLRKLQRSAEIALEKGQFDANEKRRVENVKNQFTLILRRFDAKQGGIDAKRDQDLRLDLEEVLAKNKRQDAATQQRGQAQAALLKANALKTQQDRVAGQAAEEHKLALAREVRLVGTEGRAVRAEGVAEQFKNIELGLEQRKFAKGEIEFGKRQGLAEKKQRVQEKQFAETVDLNREIFGEGKRKFDEPRSERAKIALNRLRDRLPGILTTSEPTKAHPQGQRFASIKRFDDIMQDLEGALGSEQRDVAIARWFVRLPRPDKLIIRRDLPGLSSRLDLLIQTARKSK